MKKKLGPILTIIFLLVFGVYFVENIEKFKILTSIPLYIVLVIGLLKAAVMVVNGLFTKVILSGLNKRISILETTYLSILSAIGNYFIPMRGGAGIRALYLKKRFNLPYSHFLSTLSGNYIITFLINSAVGLISIYIIYQKVGVHFWPLTISFGTVFVITLILSLLNTPEGKFLNRIKVPVIQKPIKIIQEIIQGWNVISNNKDLLFKLSALTILNFIIAYIMSFIEFSVLEFNFSVYTLLLYTSLSSLSLLISVTPGSIGIKETVFIISSTIIGITNVQILQMALLDRGIQFFVLGIAYIVSKLLNNRIKLLETIDNNDTKS